MLLYYHHSSDYWPLYHKVEFDGINKLILVHPDVTSLDIRADVYSEFIRWHAMPIRENAGYLFAIRYTGLDAIPGGFTGDTYFLINGWKLVVDITKVKITGVLFSDDYDTPWYLPSMEAVHPITVSSLVNTVTIATPVNVVTGDVNSLTTQVGNLTTAVNAIPTAPTAAANALAVRAQLYPELNIISNQSNGLTPAQLTMLTELYQLMGLDPTKPLFVSDTNRSFGTVNQTIQSGTGGTTVTRV